MADATGLLILAAAALALMHSRSAQAADPFPSEGPSAQREVDLTRWRHDGSQPLYWSKGNGAPVLDETVKKFFP